VGRDPANPAERIETGLEEGVRFQPAGSSSMKLRLLPPFCLTDAELEAGFASLERALRRVASRHGLESRASESGDERERID